MKKIIKIALTGLFGLAAYALTFATIQQCGNTVAAPHITGKMASALSSSQCHVAEENGCKQKSESTLSHWEMARHVAAPRQVNAH